VTGVIVLISTVKADFHLWWHVQAFYFTSSLLGMYSGDGQFRSQPRDWLCL